MFRVFYIASEIAAPVILPSLVFRSVFKHAFHRFQTYQYEQQLNEQSTYSRNEENQEASVTTVFVESHATCLEDSIQQLSLVERGSDSTVKDVERNSGRLETKTQCVNNSREEGVVPICPENQPGKNAHNLSECSKEIICTDSFLPQNCEESADLFITEAPGFDRISVKASDAERYSDSQADPKRVADNNLQSEIREYPVKFKIENMSGDKTELLETNIQGDNANYECESALATGFIDSRDELNEKSTTHDECPQMGYNILSYDSLRHADVVIAHAPGFDRVSVKVAGDEGRLDLTKTADDNTFLSPIRMPIVKFKRDDTPGDKSATVEETISSMNKRKQIPAITRWMSNLENVRWPSAMN